MLIVLKHNSLKVGLIVVFMLSLLVLTETLLPKVFCVLPFDSSGCLECPKNSSCFGSRFKCDDGFVEDFIMLKCFETNLSVDNIRSKQEDIRNLINTEQVNKLSEIKEYFTQSDWDDFDVFINFEGRFKVDKNDIIRVTSANRRRNICLSLSMICVCSLYFISQL